MFKAISIAALILATATPSFAQGQTQSAQAAQETNTALADTTILPRTFDYIPAEQFVVFPEECATTVPVSSPPACAEKGFSDITINPAPVIVPKKLHKHPACARSDTGLGPTPWEINCARDKKHSKLYKAARAVVYELADCVLIWNSTPVYIVNPQ